VLRSQEDAFAVELASRQSVCYPSLD